MMRVGTTQIQRMRSEREIEKKKAQRKPTDEI